MKIKYLKDKEDFDQREKQLRNDYMKLLDKYESLKNSSPKDTLFQTISTHVKKRALTMHEKLPIIDVHNEINLEDDLDDDEMSEILS